MRTSILFLGLLCLAAAGPAPENKNVHHLMTDEEVKEVFRTERHAVPEYEVVPIQLPRLHKRSSEYSTQLHVRAFGEDIQLWLNPTDGILFDANTPISIIKSARMSERNPRTKIRRVDNAMINVEAILEDLDQRATMFVKKLENGKSSVSGIIGKKRLVIAPLPERVNHRYNLRPKGSVNDAEHLRDDTTENDEPHHHVVYKLPERDPKANYAAMARPHFHRTKMRARSKKPQRVVPEVVYPQVLVFVDYETFKIHGESIDRIFGYLVGYWNGVDLRYREFEDPKIRLNVAGIVIAGDATAFSFISRNKKSNTTVNIFDALEDFWKFTETITYYFPDNSYDLAVTISPYTMCVKRENDVDNCRILGLAFYAGMCQDYKTAVIVDHGAFDGVDTTVHELGHLFGLDHDGHDKCPDDSYIMSPYSVPMPNSVDWSNCSLKQLNQFFRGRRGMDPTCLFNKPEANSPLPRILPGSILTRDQQCERLYGTKSCSIEPIGKLRCVRLSCQSADSPELCIAKTDAVDGTICAPGKLCIHGECVPQSEFLQSLHG